MDLTSPFLALKSLDRRENVPAEALVQAKVILDHIRDDKDDHMKQIEAAILYLLKCECWECVATGFVVSKYLLENQFKSGEAECISETFAKEVLDNIDVHLENKEPRVRSSVVGVLEILARWNGMVVWTKFGNKLLESIEKNFEIDSNERKLEIERLAKAALNMNEAAQQATIKKPAIIHETVGWKALETSMRALQATVKGYGFKFVHEGHLSDELLDLASKKSLKHENRYVREVGYDLCASIALVCGNSLNTPNSTAGDDAGEARNVQVINQLVEAISIGLTDNWSQVRYAASAACRNLMTSLTPEQYHPYLSVLIPRMCLNRYYLAEGVRLYSQATWKLLFTANGKEIVGQCAPTVVPFYISQCSADNHAVREAACHCIAELASKIEHHYIKDYVIDLLDALIVCFKDESWPVRDAACVAIGNFVLGFPEESRSRLVELYALWFAHLSDNIWSVREDSAIALGNVMKAYPVEGKDKVMEYLKDNMLKLKEEEFCDVNSIEFTEAAAPDSPRSIRSSSSSSMHHSHSHATSGDLTTLHKEKQANKDNRFTNQTMFSCGSLAPKLRRGVGCMDHGFSRAKMPWESTDGAVYLLRELAVASPGDAEKFMASLAEAAGYKDFKQFYALQETIWKQLPTIAKSLGKRPFKRYLEPFLPSLVHALGCSHQLTSHAAGYCVRTMRQWLGEQIFQANVQQAFNGDRLWQSIAASPLA